jgi:putative spermidine/putrescine transport system permease protein
MKLSLAHHKLKLYQQKIILAVAALPLIPLFVWTFARDWRFPDVVPKGVSLRGIELWFTPTSHVPAAVAHSMVIAICVACVSLFLAIPAGMVLGRKQISGSLHSLIVFILLLPVLTPPLASVLGIHLTFIHLGLADSVYGVILAHLISAAPLATLIMAANFAHSDGAFDATGSLEATARTLGASPLQTFFLITLPKNLLGIAIAGFIAFLISWGQYLLTLVIGGGQIMTLPLLVFGAASGSDPVITASMGLLFALPILLVLPWVFRATSSRRVWPI